MDDTENMDILGQHVLGLIKDIHQMENELASAESEMDVSLASILTDINETKGEDERKRKLDEEIRREFYELTYKMRSMPPEPNPRDQWSVTQELWRLIQKLIWKAFILQNMDPPEVPKPPKPPKPGNGPGGGGPTPTSTSSLIATLSDLVPIEKYFKQSFEVTELSCPVEKTLTVMGSARVQNVDPKQLSRDEWRRLADNWITRAVRALQTFCRLAAPEDCQSIELISISYPPKFSARPSPDGHPPFLFHMEIDVTFRCVRTV